MEMDPILQSKQWKPLFNFVQLTLLQGFLRALDTSRCTDTSSKTPDIFNRHNILTLFSPLFAELDTAGNIYKQAIFISLKKKRAESNN